MMLALTPLSSTTRCRWLHCPSARKRDLCFLVLEKHKLVEFSDVETFHPKGQSQSSLLNETLLAILDNQGLNSTQFYYYKIERTR